MVKIDPFEVEKWMNRLEETPGVLNVAETCCASVSVDDLTSLCESKSAPGPLDLSRKMTYGAIKGSEALRQGVAELISWRAPAPLSAEDVLATQGAIQANFLLFYTLIQPGDHVICVYPTYQQLYSVPESLGAEVTLWKLREENGYIPDVSELDRLVKENTKVRRVLVTVGCLRADKGWASAKMIVINNPNNPTGATIPAGILRRIVDFAKSREIIVFADEVYSPLFHSLPGGAEAPPSILSLGYERAVATGSMSKAFSLAGIRVGWVASRDRDIMEAVCTARDYTTISVSQLDDQIASYALSGAVLPSLVSRNMGLARTNLALLDSFVRKYSSVCSWTRPTAGTTALVQFKRRGEPVDDEKLVLDLLDRTKVLVMPASTCFGHGRDFKGHVRIGYVSHTEVLKEALENLGRYVEEYLA